jgi:hypothetical protein
MPTITEGARLPGALGRLVAAGLNVVPVIVLAPDGDRITLRVRSDALARPNSSLRAWLATQVARAGRPASAEIAE